MSLFQRRNQKGVLIIVENLPVPNDRRVWLESQALRDAGYQVSVISIKGKNATASYELRDGIHIYRYPAPPQTDGLLSFIFEFSYCWIMSFLLSIWIAVRRGFNIIHACNPPETFWLIGVLFKPFGKKFLFDHHDLSPEMYLSRFGKTGVAYKLLLLLERMTFRVADIVTTTNETHKRIAIERGKYPAENVFIVRSGPDHHKLSPKPQNSLLKGNCQHMVSYLGVLNPQDGVDTFIEVAECIIQQHNRNDIKFVVMGSGDSLEGLKQQVETAGISSYVEFTGWVELDTIREYLSTSDICLDTMPKTPYSDAATMNKILEYMSMARPVVAFDLVETRVSAGEAAIYADPDNVQDMAEKVLTLLADPEKRAQMGQYGRELIETELAWEHQKDNLLAAYRKLA